MATASAICMTMLLLCAAAHAIKDDLVAQACRNASSIEFNAWREMNITRGTCESALRSDKRSAVAKDTRHLMLIAIDLVQRGAVAADAKVAVARRHVDTKDKGRTLNLEYCRLDYSIVALAVPLCRVMVQEYNPGHLAYALEYSECARRLEAATHDCMRRLYFEDEDKYLPWNEVKQVSDWSSIAVAMTEVMVG